jgi:hypothetical protein
MIRRFILLSVLTLLIAGLGCTRRSSEPRLVVEIPPGFTGSFVMEMGGREASPLQKDGEAYVVAVPRTGKVTTSTILVRPKVEFKNASDGSIWGFSQSVFTTGDGISVGGKIEFFVGTRKDYEAEENKKNHSGRSSAERRYEISPV